MDNVVKDRSSDGLAPSKAAAAEVGWMTAVKDWAGGMISVIGSQSYHDL